MKHHLKKSYVQLGLVILGCMILILAAISGLRRTSLISADNTTEAPRTGSAGNQALSGAVLGESQLQDLMDRSSAIVVGTVVSNICRLSADKESVNTHYTVRVDEVIHGPLQPHSIVRVSMPGGLVMFKPDGSEVTEKNQLKTLKKPIVVEGSDKIVPEGAASSKFTPPVGNPLENNKSYVLFLTEDPDAQRGFVLADLYGSGAHDMEKENGQFQLLNEIRQVVARVPAQ